MGDFVSPGKLDAVARQREYYRQTAADYDASHGDEFASTFATDFMLSIMPRLGIASVLDVGAGTGRTLLSIKTAHPTVKVIGVEPSDGLREQGCRKGLDRDELVDGDAQQLGYPDRSFDLVCAFGVLHHIPNPRTAIAEMLRVARRAIFVCDSNNFGQGGWPTRFAKQIIRAVGLWPIADFIKTNGRGYTQSAGDGIAYSYSLFDDYPQIAASCREVRFLGTENSGPNLYRTAAGVAILGIKDGTTPR